jgi:hypothetical protein
MGNLDHFSNHSVVYKQCIGCNYGLLNHYEYALFQRSLGMLCTFWSTCRAYHAWSILYKWKILRHGNICDSCELKLFANIWSCKNYFCLGKLSSIIWNHFFIQHLTSISLTVQVLRLIFLIACLLKIDLNKSQMF